jgi:GTP-binding protein
LLADAALVGFPNAGKSTLVSRLSAARPKIADYPFTTLEPNLGVVTVDERQFVLADIPGLVEGAAEGRGLGHEFLRHVERARALVVLLDPTDMQETPFPEQLAVLERELAHHSAALARLPRVIAVNKIDAHEDPRLLADWAEQRAVHVHMISAATGEGLEALAHAIADMVDTARRAAPERPGFVLHRPLESDFSVTRSGGVWLVEGRAAQRAIRLADLTVPEAADLASRRLARIGVAEALRAAGAEPGDDVQIGDLVFTFDPEAVGTE